MQNTEVKEQGTDAKNRIHISHASLIRDFNLSTDALSYLEILREDNVEMLTGQRQK